MSQRAELEDKHTVICLGCNAEWIDPSKKPGQKYAKRCKNCGRTSEQNQRIARRRKLDSEQRGMINALAEFCDTIEDTGGVKKDDKGYHVPVADEDWIDLGEAYMRACDALGRKPVEES